jgi:hypothetical protein
MTDWDGCFKSWTGYFKGWRDWYHRVSAKNRGFWEKYKIKQCITLSLSDMPWNESFLIAASYFWSDALNAFLFGHGPRTMTLADVLLLTGLDISSSDTLFSYRGVKPFHRLKTKNVGGWAGYITEHMKDGTVIDREHVAFPNMWLEKLVFCGKSFSPTSNCQIVAEQLAHGSSIPLGKYLLGAVYNLLHQVAVSLSTNSPIGSPGGPWWFINFWLNLYL